MSETALTKKKKIFAVASFGGHWIQLLRIAKPLEEFYNITYISTNKKCSTMVDGKKFYSITDFSRWNAWKMFFAVFSIIWILLKERPTTIISTGAAPGLLVLLIAKFLFFRKTIWIDSFANASQLSFCGKLALKFSIDHVYTQWEHLCDSRIKYSGNILG